MNLKSIVSKKRKKSLLIVPFVFLAFGIEVVGLLKGYELKELSLFLSFALMGFLAVLHFSAFTLKKKICIKILKGLNNRSLEIEPNIVMRIFTFEINALLRKAFVFFPRIKNSKETKSKEVFELKLEKFLENHRAYSELNALDEKEAEVIDGLSKLKFLPLEASTDALLLLAPVLILYFSPFKSIYFLALTIGTLRLFTTMFYFSLYRESVQVESSVIEKVQTFLNAEFEEESFATRIDFEKIIEDSSEDIFLLIDGNRKEDLKKVIKNLVSSDEFFKNKIVISLNGKESSLVTSLDSAIFLFPSELDFSHLELEEFIKGFKEVLIIDVDPILANSRSSIYYLDQDQDIKKVKAVENLSRLSGDKGLILRNLEKLNNLKTSEFLGEKVEPSKEAYLVFEKELKNNETYLMYSSKEHGVRIESSYNESFEEQIYCRLESKTKIEKTNEAKAFIANCAYHGLLSKKLKSSLNRAS